MVKVSSVSLRCDGVLLGVPQRRSGGRLDMSKVSTSRSVGVFLGVPAGRLSGMSDTLEKRMRLDGSGNASSISESSMIASLGRLLPRVTFWLAIVLLLIVDDLTARVDFLGAEAASLLVDERTARFVFSGTVETAWPVGAGCTARVAFFGGAVTLLAEGARPARVGFLATGAISMTGDEEKSRVAFFAGAEVLLAVEVRPARVAFLGAGATSAGGDEGTSRTTFLVVLVFLVTLLALLAVDERFEARFPLVARFAVLGSAFAKG